jgi:hypothetical protein
MLLQNKWEHVSERQLDIVIDHLNTLNDLTPKVPSRVTCYSRFVYALITGQMR